MPGGANRGEACCSMSSASSLDIAASTRSNCWEQRQAGAEIRRFARGVPRSMEKKLSGYYIGYGKRPSNRVAKTAGRVAGAVVARISEALRQIESGGSQQSSDDQCGANGSAAGPAQGSGG